MIRQEIYIHFYDRFIKIQFYFRMFNINRNMRFTQTTKPPTTYTTTIIMITKIISIHIPIIILIRGKVFNIKLVFLAVLFVKVLSCLNFDKRMICDHIQS